MAAKLRASGNVVLVNIRSFAVGVKVNAPIIVIGM